MKSVFDKGTSNDLIDRINALNEKSTARWGKMNVCQMLTLYKVERNDLWKTEI